MGRPATESNGQLVPAKKQQKTLGTMLLQMKPEIAKAVPSHLNPERMARICSTAIRTTPNLDRCDAMSFLGCVMSAAQLGLEPNTHLGYCYLIPRKTKGGGYECTMMLGYQGMMDLARRSGTIASIRAHVVREGDHLEVQYGLNPRLEHTPKAPTSANITHAYAVAKFKDGSDDLFEILDRDQIEKRRARGFGKGAWVTDYEAMAKKSAVRALWAWLPKSSEAIVAGTHLSEAAEAGRSTASALDPDIQHMLAEAGVEATEADIVDPETGEVTHAA